MRPQPSNRTVKTLLVVETSINGRELRVFEERAIRETTRANLFKILVRRWAVRWCAGFTELWTNNIITRQSSQWDNKWLLLQRIHEPPFQIPFYSTPKSHHVLRQHTQPQMKTPRTVYDVGLIITNHSLLSMGMNPYYFSDRNRYVVHELIVVVSTKTHPANTIMQKIYLVTS